MSSSLNPILETSNSLITDVSSPYFLHSSDHPGAILVSNVLTGDNYSTWKRSMKMALNAKNKLGFIDGSIQKPSSTSQDLKTWERCNDMVLSWMLNGIEKNLANSLIYCDTPRSLWLGLEERFSQSNNPRIYELKRAICNHQQEQKSLVIYFNTLKFYWDELSTLTIISSCKCETSNELQGLLETEKVFQFLMGLNDSYSSVRSQILAMEPLPNVGKAYSIIHQEERQRLLHVSSQPSIESTALTANNKTQMTSRQNHSHLSHLHGVQETQGRGRPFCDHCEKYGHIKAKCYKIVGYPPNWKHSNRSHVAAPATTKPQQLNDHPIPTDKNSSSQPTIQIPGLTAEQYQQLLSILSTSEQPSTANLAGPFNEEADWKG
ncbi:retrotran gag 3 domain-containing protein [Citrus sinensis]|nr:retrotran gag 3 domain-containing protein [Citrus sinensis]